jgi:proline iminopeptidase
MRQYSTARLVADLEAIRIVIGSDKLILIGQSWGNTLAVDYVAAHPDRVAKLIFSSPGAMWDVARFEFNYSRVANVGEDPGFTPPQMAALLLAARNSIIATQIMSEPSLAAAADAMPASVKIENNYCAGAEARIPMAPILGSNPYVNRLVFASQKSYPDPRPSLRDNATPALIMRGECDFVPLAVAQEYLATFPQARLVQFSGAGHALYAIHPSEVLAEITGFLGN